MAEMRQFKAESKRLLDLMINSIYTHKEIFLRELISNASDAIDKLYYRSLSENLSDVAQDQLKINISFDEVNRTITIEDNGIGMNYDDIVNNFKNILGNSSILSLSIKKITPVFSKEWLTNLENFKHNYSSP